MSFTQRTRGIVRAIAIVLSLAVPLVMAISAADARVGGGGSSGSRGTRTFSAPPSTTTAPGTAQPFNRTFTQPGSPGMGAPAAAGGRRAASSTGLAWALLGGLAAGFLGAGLLGMLFGGGMFSGLGGLSSIIGLMLQIGLIIIVVRLAMSWWQRRHTPAAAYAGGPAAAPGAQTGFGSGMGFGLGSNSAPLEILPADYEAFERLLGEIQAAWSNEDVAKLHTLATPEMVSYFSKDLEQNKANNDVNKVSDGKAAAGRPRGSLARRRNRLCERRDALLAGRQDAGAHHRPCGRGQRNAGRSDGGLDLRAATWRQLGTLGDPADQLIDCRLRHRTI